MLPSLRVTGRQGLVRCSRVSFRSIYAQRAPLTGFYFAAMHSKMLRQPFKGRTLIVIQLIYLQAFVKAAGADLAKVPWPIVKDNNVCAA